MTIQIKEPVNALTHFIGSIFSILGLVLLLYYANVQATAWHIVSFTIYGSSMFLLYTTSTLYHALNLSQKKTNFLHKLDHIMIYILIAGTYTPICLVPLRGGWGWSLFGVIWLLATIGIILKIYWFNAPRWLSTLFYILMGWVVVIAFVPLVKTTPIGGVIFLILGGIFYTIGGIIYGTKKPNFAKKIGFHELFHIFVLAGSLCHYIFMLKYIMLI